MNGKALLLRVVLLGLTYISCRSPTADWANEKPMRTVNVAFQIDLNEPVYRATMYGNPPQMAIWLQNPSDQSIRTVMLTYRMGSGDWKGKTKCDVALPYWVGFFNRQTGTSGPPTQEHPAPDAVTYATPKEQLIVRTRLPEGSRWNYFIEVNVSGDFNADFPKKSKYGRTDRDGNGQPSLVYGGAIETVKGTVSQPAVLGCTDQYGPVTRLTENIDGITTALKLLKTIKVSCW